MADEFKIENQIIEYTKNQDNSFISKMLRFPYSFYILAGIILVLYIQVFSFQLGKLDENSIIQANTSYLQNLDNFGDSFSKDAFYGIRTADFYRPIQNMSFFFDYSLSRDKGWGYYFFNLLIHILTCFSLLKLLELLKIGRRMSFLLTLLFAVSPLFVQAIAWAPGRGDLLIGLFGSLSLSTLLLFFQRKKIIYLVTHFILFGLAVFSKETAIVLAGIYIIIWFYEKRENQKVINLLILSPVYLIFAGIYMILRNDVVILENQVKTIGLSPLLTNLRTIPEILIKFLVPVNLSPVPSYDFLTTILGIFILLIISYCLMRFKLYRNPNAITGICIFLVTIIPGMFYTHEYKTFAYSYLEHRAYLPSIGIVVLLGAIFSEILKRKDNYFFAILLIASVFLFSYNFVYQKHYKDPKSFYSFSIEKNPNSIIAYNNLAQIYLDANQFEEAAGYLKAALKIMPKYPEALNNLGIYYANINKYDSSIIMLSRSIELNPYNANTYINRGIAQSHLGNFEAGFKDFNQALVIMPNLSDALVNRGNARYSLKDRTGACADWKAAAELGNRDGVNMLNKYCK